MTQDAQTDKHGERAAFAAWYATTDQSWPESVRQFAWDAWQARALAPSYTAPKLAGGSKPDGEAAWFEWRAKYPDAPPYEIFVAAYAAGASSVSATEDTKAIGLLRMWEEAAHTDNYSPGSVIEEQTRKLIASADGGGAGG